MRAHNIGFYKPSHWHVWCQVIRFCWWGSSLLDVHFKLSIITLKTKQFSSVNIPIKKKVLLLNPHCNSYRLWPCHRGFWCGCWLHSSGSLSGHFGWSLQGWQAGELGESGQWGNCAGPVGTCGHRWSGFLQQDTYGVSVIRAPSQEMRVLSNVLWLQGAQIQASLTKRHFSHYQFQSVL